MERIERETSSAEIDFKLIVSRKAEVEIINAFTWYEEQREGLGFEFFQLLDKTLKFIKYNPVSYQIIHRNIRRVLLSKFPYAIFYIIENHQIIILGCFHQRRHPGEWLSEM